MTEEEWGEAADELLGRERYYGMDGEPLTWRQWSERRMENPDARRVALTKIGNYEVSTVLLGIDHRFSRSGPPIIFETMIFDQTGITDDSLGNEVFCDRYTNKVAALAGHDQACERARRRDFE